MTTGDENPYGFVLGSILLAGTDVRRRGLTLLLCVDPMFMLTDWMLPLDLVARISVEFMFLLFVRLEVLLLRFVFGFCLV